jgi:hypothetical protein
MQHHVHAHVPGTAAIEEPLDFGAADLLALPVLLVLCLLFFLVGVWDTLREHLLPDGQQPT